MSNLAVIIEQSGIEKSTQLKIVDVIGQYFTKAQEWETAIQSIEITDPNQIEEMEFAKSLRLEMKRTRLQGEKIITQKRADIKLRMADDVLEDKLWLRVGQMMEAQYANLEGKAQEKERFAEIYEANRILKLRETRNGQIQSEPALLEFIPSSIDLGSISEDDYGKLLSGAKLQRDAKIAAEQRAIEEKLLIEAKQREEQLRLEKEREEQRIAMEQENERLRLENIEKDKAMKAEQERAKAEKDRQDAIIEKERKEAAELAKKLELARQKELEDAIERARLLAESEKQLAREQAEKERLESEKYFAAERENARIESEKQMKIALENQAKAEKEKARLGVFESVKNISDKTDAIKIINILSERFELGVKI